jgi:hypothetical protein
MRISDALAKARPLTVEFDSDSMNITYRPSSYSVEKLEQLVEEDGSERKVAPRRMIEMIQNMVISWDLLEDNGEPIDLQNTARLRQLPSSIFLTILNAVKADQSAGEAERPSAAS